MKIQPFNMILGGEIVLDWYGNPGQRDVRKKHFENGKFQIRSMEKNFVF